MIQRFKLLRSETKDFIVGQFIALILFFIGCYLLKSPPACFVVFIIFISNSYQSFKKLEMAKQSSKEKL